jgi:CBS domain-containing protein
MLCEELMKTDVECVSPVDSIEDAARLMREANVGFLPVCDESRRVLGTITDRDIAIRAVADALPGSTPVEDVMTDEVVACSPKEDVEAALELMGENRKSRIICLDGEGHLAGIISLSDIAQLGEVGASDALRQVSGREARSN